MANVDTAFISFIFHAVVATPAPDAKSSLTKWHVHCQLVLPFAFNFPPLYGLHQWIIEFCQSSFERNQNTRLPKHGKWAKHTSTTEKIRVWTSTSVTKRCGAKYLIELNYELVSWMRFMHFRNTFMRTSLQFLLWFSFNTCQWMDAENTRSRTFRNKIHIFGMHDRLLCVES